ncbi:hypothetical protein F2P81_014793 [Scophthalmus maximus]|uniref:Uncharacterized protein n=1 Tax=Scophthalmus maximus TaxID=52904 RepID=A0A6A4SEB5_SCOMX|nr:hypothetical protein F2P81_014793 [Scophthalmus maximus]
MILQSSLQEKVGNGDDEDKDEDEEKEEEENDDDDDAELDNSFELLLLFGEFQENRKTTGRLTEAQVTDPNTRAVCDPAPEGETEQLAGVHVHQRRTIVYTLPGPSVGGSRNEARGVRGTGSSSVGEKKKNRKHVGKHTTTNSVEIIEIKFTQNIRELDQDVRSELVSKSTVN